MERKIVAAGPEKGLYRFSARDSSLRGVYTPRILEAMYGRWKDQAKRNGGFHDQRVTGVDYASLPPDRIFINVAGERTHEHYVLKEPLDTDYYFVAAVPVNMGVPESFNGAQTIVERHGGNPQAQCEAYARSLLDANSKMRQYSTEDFRLVEAVLVRAVIGSKRTLIGPKVGARCNLILLERNSNSSMDMVAAEAPPQKLVVKTPVLA